MSKRGENRRTNPTGLVHIDRKDIAITLNHNPSSDKLESYTVTGLDLKSYSFPPDALLIINIYSSVEETRNDIGVVATPLIGNNLSLEQINDSNVTFRLLVKMPGTDKLLGSCEKIKTIRSNEDSGSHRSLLHLRYEDLGQRLWRVDASGGSQPILLVNNSNSLNVREHIEANNSLVKGLIIPQAFEQCLVYLVQHWDGGASDDWQSVWKDFLGGLGVDDPEEKEDPDKVANWAFEATDKFVEKVKFANLAVEWEGAHG